MTEIRCPVNEAARMSPNEPGLVTPDGVLLCTETEQCVCATAGLLKKCGVRSGDRVGLLLEEWKTIIAYWALLRIGAVPCPLYRRTPKAVLTELNQELRMMYLFSEPENEASCPDDVGFLSAADYIGYTAPFIKHYRPTLDMAQIASIHFSVGADGERRAVVRTIGSYYYGALAGNAVVPLRSRDRILLKPLYTFQGLDVVFRAIMSGAAPVCDSEAPISQETIEKYEISHLNCSTADEADAWNAVLSREKAGVRTMLINELISPELRQQLKERSIQPYCCPCSMLTGYTGCIFPPDNRLDAHRYAQFRCSDQGSLEVRGDMLFDGYFTSGTKQSYDKLNMWLDSGLPVTCREDGAYVCSQVDAV